MSIGFENQGKINRVVPPSNQATLLQKKKIFWIDTDFGPKITIFPPLKWLSFEFPQYVGNEPQKMNITRVNYLLLRRKLFYLGVKFIPKIYPLTQEGEDFGPGYFFRSICYHYMQIRKKKGKNEWLERKLMKTFH